MQSAESRTEKTRERPDGRPSFAQRHVGLCYVAPVVAWAALIAWTSHVPGVEIPTAPAEMEAGLPAPYDTGLLVGGRVLEFPRWRYLPYPDKLGHIALYLVLGALAARALGRGRPLTPRAAALAWSATALYGLVDELHQHFVPLRSLTAADLASDILGAGLGAVLWSIFSRRTRAK
jgi:hypothetical protein